MKQPPHKVTDVVRELVERWKGRLYLGRYIIAWSWLEGSPDNKVGRYEPTVNKYRADLWFDASQPWNDLRETVVHELLHVRDRPLSELIEDLSESPYLPKPTYDTWHASVRRADECLVDEMASILCDVKEWKDADLAVKWKKLAALGKKGVK